MDEAKQALLAKIVTGGVHIGIIGMGYVGLPLALAFVERAKVKVTGFDIDPAKVQALIEGRTYAMHVAEDRLRRARATGLLQATMDFDELGAVDALVIAVPTPLTPEHEPDLQHVVSVGIAIAKRLRPGQLVVLESTTYPGTTDGVLRELLEQSGLACGRDFFLAHAPEREDPGNRRYSTTTIPRVVGGVDAASGEVAAALYARALEHVVQVESARVAEAAKLTENVFRSVNIALVNELKIVFDRMGIDIWDVLDAAATKPFGFMRFDPGPGLGGHCIPVDPFYLAWQAREAGVAARFIELAGEINVGMPHFVLEKLQAGLNRAQRAVEGSRILVLGIAYKRDSDDTRESPAFGLMRLLVERGATVAYHDPHVPSAPPAASRPRVPALKSEPLTAELLQAHDAVVICTDHTAVNYAHVQRHAKLVVDTRGVYREPRANVVKA